MAESKSDEPDEDKADFDVVRDFTELGPFKLLLNRAFSAYGNLIGGIAEEHVRKIQQKRLRNLGTHVEAVKRHVEYGTESEPTIDQQRLLLEWASNAQDVDPLDEALAAFWRTALESIDKDSEFTAECLAILPQLRPSDARMLMVLGNRRLPLTDPFRFGRMPRMSPAKREKFARLGLIHRWYEVAAFKIVLFTLIFVAILFAAASLTNLGFILMPLFIASLGVAAMMVPFILTPRLSALGKFLISRSEKYISRKGD